MRGLGVLSRDKSSQAADWAAIGSFGVSCEMGPDSEPAAGDGNRAVLVAVIFEHEPALRLFLRFEITVQIRQNIQKRLLSGGFRR